MQEIGVNARAHPQSNGLRRHILACEKYVADLSMFDKYILWRYTAGSATINTYLIMGKISDNAPFWVYLFFKFWKNTADAQNYPIGQSGVFSQWVNYFSNPEAFKQAPSASVTKDVIATYISRLHTILQQAPRPAEDFLVFKVASRYPGLPAHNDELPVDVKQMPFNSSTYDDGFNFVLFMPKDDNGRPLGNNSVLFRLRIPAGAVGALYIPDYIHAYAFEKEVLLINDSTFRIEAQYQNTNVPYIDPATVNMNTVQPNMMKINMGQVNEINTYFPCGTSGCVKKILTGVTMYRASFS